MDRRARRWNRHVARAVNRINIIGNIEGPIDLRESERGETASAALRFSPDQDTVLLFCLGERVRQLTKFRPGARVRIAGRLTINPHNHRAAILVEEACHVDPCLELEQDRELESWNASRQFQAHARVVGNRWVKRPGWVK
jgi:hypothetical protein